MGSSTAWHLSNYGKRVLLLEQQDSEYRFGSSYGEARICRSLGPKQDIWSYIHQRALVETEKLIDFLNQLSDDRHSMEDIYTTSPVMYILHTTKIRAIKFLLAQQDDPYECATNSLEAFTKFGAVLPKKTLLIQEIKKYSGTINPRVLIEKLHAAIQLKGSTVQYNQRVVNLTRSNNLYDIEIRDEKTGEVRSLQSKKIVSAAGPYTEKLLKTIAPYFETLLTTRRVYLAFLKIDLNRFGSYSKEQKQKIFDFFPFIDLNPNSTFSMIEKIDVDGVPIIKIGAHYKRDEFSSLDDVWKTELTEDEIAWGKQSILAYLNMINIPIESDELVFHHGYSCVYTLTESEVPMVTNLQIDNRMDPNAVMLGGMSGIGAKGSMTYGLMAAHLLLKKDESSFMYRKLKINLDRSIIN